MYERDGRRFIHDLPIVSDVATISTPLALIIYPTGVLQSKRWEKLKFRFWCRKTRVSGFIELKELYKELQASLQAGRVSFAGYILGQRVGVKGRLTSWGRRGFRMGLENQWSAPRVTPKFPLGC